MCTGYNENIQKFKNIKDIYCTNNAAYKIDAGSKITSYNFCGLL